jgi:hypothetical protein
MRSLLHKALPAAEGLLLSVVLFFFFLAPAWGAAYTEVFHTGKIDWSKGVAEAVGTAVISPQKSKSEKARSAAAEEAVKSARANLLDLVGRIKVDSRTTVKDLIQLSEPLGNKIQDLVAKVAPRRVRFRNKGRVEATVAISMNGPLSEMILPQSISAIDSVQSKAASQNSDKEAFTGVLVDCSGIKIRPALFPTIVDEEGQLVYGSPHIHREYAVKKGVAAYTRSADGGEREERVGPRPLVLRGIRAAKTGPSDIVVSNTDAGKAKSSANNIKLLQNCRVMIILE